MDAMVFILSSLLVVFPVFVFWTELRRRRILRDWAERNGCEILDGEREIDGWRDDLHRPVHARLKRRSQYFVAPHDLGQAALQRPHVEGAAQAGG